MRNLILSNKMEEREKGLSIRKLGNSIQFTTPEGKTYFKNWSNFVNGLSKGQKVFNAPVSIKKNK